MNFTLLFSITPAIVTFVIGILITPIVTHFLYKHHVWKKQGGKTALGGKIAEVFNELKGEHETKTPRMGGIVIWASGMITLISFYLYCFQQVSLLILIFLLVHKLSSRHSHSSLEP